MKELLNVHEEKHFLELVQYTTSLNCQEIELAEEHPQNILQIIEHFKKSTVQVKQVILSKIFIISATKKEPSEKEVHFLSTLFEELNPYEDEPNKIYEYIEESTVLSNATDYILGKLTIAKDIYTGKMTFDKAESLRDKIEKKYNRKKLAHEQEIFEINNRFVKCIDTINMHKKEIYEKYFQKFINLVDRIHNLNIHGESFLEYFNHSITEIKNINAPKDKKELYAIDFNDLKILDIFGIASGGFDSRKKAKETLIKVSEERVRVNEEVAKIQSHITQVKVTLESIENVAFYFEQLVSSYSKLLDRFEYGISSQTQQQILRGVKLENGKLDFKLLPIVHIEEFRALFNLSIVLKQMATMGYLTTEGEIENQDMEALNNIQHKVEELKLLTA